MMRRLLMALRACGILLATASLGWAQQSPPATNLTDLSLEELMNIEVTSVSKKAEPLSGAAAAVYVLTDDDIRRSGATTFADALRLVPGLHVAQIDSSKWAVAARGFNSRYVNKMLVLVDGRSVYLPLFSGVYWELLDYPLDDVDRIEIVRGPGGSLWGANAVNGIVNIITKSAKDTPGGLIEASASTNADLIGTVRYGGRLGESAWFRIYAKDAERGNLVDQVGNDMPDEWRLKQTGFRLDWEQSDQDTFTFQGDYYESEAEKLLAVARYDSPVPVIVEEQSDRSGWNLLGRWTRALGDESDFTLQAYYQRAEDEELTFSRITDEVADVDFQHRFKPHDRHEVVWGLGYRRTTEKAPGTIYFSMRDPERSLDLYSAFVQDQITLTPDRLHLTVGSKVEHNSYTGFEVQPSVRLTWDPSEHRTVWAAVTRAVRTPSRVDRDMSFTSAPIEPGVYPRLNGSENLDAEVLFAYELGYRVRPSTHVSLDAALFLQDYDNLRSIEPGPPFLETSPPPPHFIAPLTGANLLDGQAYGIELAANVHATDWWLLRSGYSVLRLDLQHDATSLDTLESRARNEAPRHTAFLRSSMDLPGGVALDTVLRYIDTVPAYGIDSFLELDARVAWRPHEQFEVFVTGRNLLHDHHQEYGAKYIANLSSDVVRSVYAGVTWRF